MTTSDGAPLIALDTNVLVYAEGVDDIARRDRALALLTWLERPGFVLPVQVVGEYVRVLRRKARRTAEQASAAADAMSARAMIAPTTDRVLSDALDICARHGFDIWDAVILAAAQAAGCRLLLSEDFSDGFVWRGLTVADPFAGRLHPLLVSALES